jgi:C_GCAxxG_C_C family probable redox protein
MKKITSRVAECIRLFNGGMNCNEAMLKVFIPEGIDAATSFKLKKFFLVNNDGNRMCGAFISSLMILGAMKCNLSEDSESAVRQFHHLQNELQSNVKSRLGSVTCSDLSKCELIRRKTEFYKDEAGSQTLRNCVPVIAEIATILEKSIE